MSEDAAAALQATPASMIAAETTIYKILTIEEWDEFQKIGTFIGNPLDQWDGYIHMSYYDQVHKTIQKFFAGRESEILLVHVNTALLHENELRPERNKPEGERYPHIYGSIPINAVIKTTKTLQE
jgi:uncharacterized protein (DUF952 family)